MTTIQALQSITSYPVSASTLNRILLDRGLDSSLPYTQGVGASVEFRLSMADLYKWLSTGANSIREQESAMTIDDATRSAFATMANNIYIQYGDPLAIYTETYGYMGEFYNGEE